MSLNPLITAAELGGVLGDVTLLDVRYRTGGPPGREEYAAGHIPGAAYVDLDADLADPPGPRGRHPLPDPDRFAAAMTAAGVRRDRPVVVYDDWAGRAAARCWWLLRFHGHSDVRVLDGGWAAWVRSGGADEAGVREDPPGSPGDFAADPGHLPVIEAADVLTFAGTLVDARERPRYLGETEPIDPVAGHIPGAVNVPTSANLDEDGTFRSVEGLYPDGPVAAYCGSGVTATHDLLALAILGREGVLYPGSWSEWVADPTRPVERG